MQFALDELLVLRTARVTVVRRTDRSDINARISMTFTTIVT